jgi:hypothetical protein
MVKNKQICGVGLVKIGVDCLTPEEAEVQVATKRIVFTKKTPKKSIKKVVK